MKSAVCTLFEGSYHYGVAALVNSLQSAGYHGTVYAGFRGDAPAWASAAIAAGPSEGQGSRTLRISAQIDLVLVPLSTSAHLTNYKPEFMLRLLDGPASGAPAIFYIDPDICVQKPWRYFEEWISCGVALCEDLNSPLSAQHPRRVGWRRYYGGRGLELQFRQVEYVNGGFVGLQTSARSFLETWRLAMNLMGEEIGSLAAAKLSGGARYRSTGFADCFDCSDQDALNAAVEASSEPVSIAGQEAMAFKPGPALLPHAVGGAKPWQRGYLATALGGMPPRLVDRAFWGHVRAPLAPYGRVRVAVKRLDLLAGAAVGRLLRRA